MNQLCGQGEGNGSPDIVGTLYFPTQTFNLANSNGKLLIQGKLLAANITGENGGGKFTVNSELANSSAIKRLSLVQ